MIPPRTEQAGPRRALRCVASGALTASLAALLPGIAFGHGYCGEVEVTIPPSAGDLVPFALVLAITLVTLERRRESPNPRAQAAVALVLPALALAAGLAFLGPITPASIAPPALALLFVLIAVARPRPRGRIALALAVIVCVAAIAPASERLSGQAKRQELQCYQGEYF